VRAEDSTDWSHEAQRASSLRRLRRAKRSSWRSKSSKVAQLSAMQRAACEHGENFLHQSKVDKPLGSILLWWRERTRGRRCVSQAVGTVSTCRRSPPIAPEERCSVALSGGLGLTNEGRVLQGDLDIPDPFWPFARGDHITIACEKASAQDFSKRDLCVRPSSRRARPLSRGRSWGA